MAVVVAARRPPVLDGGRPTLGPGPHVVDLALLGRHLAELRVAHAIAHLDRPPGGAGEESSALAHVDHPPGAVEHDPLDLGFGKPRNHDPGVTTVPPASSQTRPAKVS
jgi:hypothetical protein